MESSEMLNNANREHCQIIDIIQSEGIELRPQGRELVGLCPFHADKRPSLRVSPDKNKWFCFPCHEGGDAIRFIEKLHGIGFKDAINLLGIGNGTPPPRRSDPAKREAQQIAERAQDTSRRVCAALREISDSFHICSLARNESYCDKRLIAEHEASLARAWELLCDLDDDLSQPETALELWRSREDIDAFVDAL